jgi:hypothetical protein
MTAIRQDWVSVGEFTVESEAHIARGMLSAAGIPSVLRNDTIASVYPMTMTWAPIELLVPADMASRAVLLLGSHGDIPVDDSKSADS